MRRIFVVTSLGCLVFALSALKATAQSSKAATAINQMTYCANTNSAQAANPCTQTNSVGATEGIWYNVMTTTIKTSSIADLFVNPSLVTGLYTNTTVKGNSTGSTSTAVGEGTVKVRVLLDPSGIVTAGQQGCQDTSTLAPCGGTSGFPDAHADGVTFDQRIQVLTANLGFIFGGAGSACLTDITQCTAEQIQLILDTTSAHSFNFIFLNVGTGTHTLVVQAEVDTSNTSSFTNGNGGVSIANATFGLGSLTVDSVRLVNSFSF
jgi:hypothetical protein